MSGLPGDQAGQHVLLIHVGGSDQQVHILDARLQLRRKAGAVSLETDHVVGSGCIFDHPKVRIHYCYFMAFIVQLLGDGLSHLSAAGYQNIHRIVLAGQMTVTFRRL